MKCWTPIVGLLVLTIGVLSYGEDEPKTSEPLKTSAEIRKAVDRWLDDLGADTFVARETARKGLERYGREAKDLLEARRDDPDPEIRRTVLVLLERLGGVEPPPADPGDLEALGRVTLDLPAGLALDGALARLGRPRAASFQVPDGAKPLPTRVHLEKVPFFEAVDRLLEGQALHAQASFDRHGRLALAPGEAQEPAYAVGPFRARVVEVTSTHQVARPHVRRFALGIELDWVPTVQVLTWRNPKGIAARDENGARLEAGPASRSNRVHGISHVARSTRVLLHLEPEAEVGGSIRELLFDLPIRLRHDRVEREIPVGALPATVEVDGAQVTLQSFEKEAASNGPWIAQLEARLGGRVASQSIQVWFLAPEGDARLASAGSRFTSSDGRTTLLARAWGRWEKPPTRVRVVWFRTEEEGDVGIRLQDIPLR